MSSPSQPSGRSSYGVTRDSASSSKAVAATTSVGSSTSKSSGFSSRSSSAILPPTSTVSARRAELPQHAELVLDLGPANDEHERPLDVAEQPAEVAELVEEQQPRVGGQDVRDGLGRRVGAVRGAEGVVDVEVAAVGELAGEALVVRRLARSKRVFSSTSTRSSSRSSWSRSRRARSGRRVLALRPAEVRADADAFAPRSSSSRSVGSAARIRVSSATRPASSGTFRSARTRTVVPSTSAVSTDRGSLTCIGG
jgi:hypothetical protein